LDTPNTKVVSKFSKIRKKSDLKKKSKIEQKNKTSIKKSGFVQKNNHQANKTSIFAPLPAK